MPPRRKKQPKLVTVWLLRKDGHPQRYKVRGLNKARNKPNYLTNKQAQQLQRERAPRRAGPPRATPRPGPPRTVPATPVPTPVAPPTTRRGARYSTWFRAMGTMGSAADLKDPYLQNLLEDNLEEFGAPAQFYSNQGGLLGQVKFAGRVPLEVLIDRLNLALQFVGEESRDFDFRIAYRRWSYRYQIIETLGPTDHVIEEASDEHPRRRRR